MSEAPVYDTLKRMNPALNPARAELRTLAAEIQAGERPLKLVHGNLRTKSRLNLLNFRVLLATTDRLCIDSGYGLGSKPVLLSWADVDVVAERTSGSAIALDFVNIVPFLSSFAPAIRIIDIASGAEYYVRDLDPRKDVAAFIRVVHEQLRRSREEQGIKQTMNVDPQHSSDVLLERLERLKSLLDSGALSESEFEQQKQAILKQERKP